VVDGDESSGIGGLCVFFFVELQIYFTLRSPS
jgi:hypothetical protein